MDVLQLPDFSATNPYQKRLKTALESLDVNVTLGSEDGIFSIFREILDQPDVSVLHIHWLHVYWVKEDWLRSFIHTIILILQLIYVKGRGIALVWTIHNLYEHENHYPKLESILKTILISISDSVIVHSNTVKSSILFEFCLPQSFHFKVKVIPHGHFIDSYPNQIDRDEARNRLDVPLYHQVFLFFGSLRPYKGLQVLVDAFQDFTFPETRLIIAGKPHWQYDPGPLKNKCEDDNRIITLFEFIEDEHVQWFMNATDCVVLPFAKIFTSGSAILAMSFGKALIVPRNEYLEELIPEGGAIFYDSDEGEHGLKRALMASRDKDLQSMGQKNYQAIKKQNWNQIARQTFQIYENY